jgi:hypothetical protein
MISQSAGSRCKIVSAKPEIRRDVSRSEIPTRRDQAMIELSDHQLGGADGRRAGAPRAAIESRLQTLRPVRAVGQMVGRRRPGLTSRLASRDRGGRPTSAQSVARLCSPPEQTDCQGARRSHGGDHHRPPRLTEKGQHE